MILYYVEWTAGITTGKFYTERDRAEKVARYMALETGVPATLTPIAIPSLDPDFLVTILNGEETDKDQVRWQAHDTVIYHPQGH